MRNSTRAAFVCAVLLTATLACPRAVFAVALKEARVTQIIQDVRLVSAQDKARAAALSDQVRDGMSVRTGVKSRTELTFPDETITRLGATTVFSFGDGTRNLDLGGGAMLLRVPKGSGGATIVTSAITAGITGTTVMFEYHAKSFYKFIVLEGSARVSRNGHRGDSVLVSAGQMLIGVPGGPLNKPVGIDLEQLVSTSKLIVGFGKLPSASLITAEIRKQHRDKEAGVLTLAPGEGVFDPTSHDQLDRAANALPTPPPKSDRPPQD